MHPTISPSAQTLDSTIHIRSRQRNFHEHMTHEVFHLHCLQINCSQSLYSNTVNSDAVIVRDFIIYSELKLRAFPHCIDWLKTGCRSHKD